MRSNWKASSRVRRRGHDIPNRSVASVNSNPVINFRSDNSRTGNNIDTETMTSTLPSLSIMEEEAMKGRVIISTSTIGEETRNDVIDELNSSSYEKKKKNTSLKELFSAEDVLSEQFNNSHDEFYSRSLTGMVVNKVWNSKLCELACRECKYWRNKLYDSKNTLFRVRMWKTLQLLWFSLLVMTIISMLRLSNQLGVPNEKVVGVHRLKAKVATPPPRSTSHIGHSIPQDYSNLADIASGFQAGTDIPYFWHIPRSAGASMAHIMGTCMNLVLASNSGVRQGHDKDTSLKVVTMGDVSYVNVDTNTAQGIERVKKMRLSSSGLADVVISSRIFDAASIFSSRNQGRLFTFFRHPVDRAASLFHYTQDTVWRRNNVKEYKNISILDYFKSSLGESNWMTRFLTNNLRKALSEKDLDAAKEILRRKCLIGLFSKKSESFYRMKQYFNWQIKDETTQNCLDKKLDWAWPLKHKHDPVEEGTDVWNAIAVMNQYDIKLYEYAQQLFREQSQLFQ